MIEEMVVGNDALPSKNLTQTQKFINRYFTYLTLTYGNRKKPMVTEEIKEEPIKNKSYSGAFTVKDDKFQNYVSVFHNISNKHKDFLSREEHSLVRSRLVAKLLYSLEYQDMNLDSFSRIVSDAFKNPYKTKEMCYSRIK